MIEDFLITQYDPDEGSNYQDDEVIESKPTYKEAVAFAKDKAESSDGDYGYRVYGVMAQAGPQLPEKVSRTIEFHEYTYE